MEHLKKHFDVLGYKVEDMVTGFEGVITTVSFDLYGCIQVVVDPGLDKDGKPMDSKWFDIARLKTTSDEPVMKQPDFEIVSQISNGEKGPSEKPDGRF